MPTTPLGGYHAVFKWWVGSIANPGPPPLDVPPALIIGVDSRGSFTVDKIPWPLSEPPPTKRLKAGVYDVLLKDRTSVHNIHLRGVGVDRRTSVPGVTVAGNHIKLAWRNVRLRPGKLSIYSDRAPTKRISITVVS